MHECFPNSILLCFAWVAALYKCCYEVNSLSQHSFPPHAEVGCWVLFRLHLFLCRHQNTRFVWVASCPPSKNVAGEQDGTRREGRGGRSRGSRISDGWAAYLMAKEEVGPEVQAPKRVVPPGHQSAGFPGRPVEPFEGQINRWPVLGRDGCPLEIRP